MGTTIDRTAEEAKTLLSALQQKFPSKTLGEDRWYILALISLIAAGQCDHAPTLYTYLISQPRYQTSESRQALMRRLRESLVKSVSVVGVPKPLEAVHQISAVERPEDKDYSFSR
ncbi:MAG: hypothetical protein OHK93_007254 [Ramalina farinacea]|uniref:Uncharacterized protein n=1 Tax=Ramalina farinacea TaxID=258253 RepID=A0AA43TVC8_9LECA|nr:hypothetical protein [Ramalina farinacea]